MKKQKGITLIALIITIVVLLILAAVAISSIQNDGILRYAENAADNWNKAQSDEETALQNYLNYLDKNTGVIVEPKVGQYVEYDVGYTDMYQGTVYDNSEEGKYGWRYLGTETDAEGKIKHHLLVSTAIPMKLYYHCDTEGGSAKWWDTAQTNANAKATQGMIKNFDKIPFAQKASGTSMSSVEENTSIGDFAPSKRTYNGTEYDAVGDYFKVTGKSYSNNITVRTLTLAELNRAVNNAMNAERNETSTAEGFKDIPAGNMAYGLFDMQDLIGYTANYAYWLASPRTSNTDSVYLVYYDYSNVSYDYVNYYGVRPVVVLPSDIQFTDLDNNTVLEIK